MFQLMKFQLAEIQLVEIQLVEIQLAVIQWVKFQWVKFYSPLYLQNLLSSWWPFRTFGLQKAQLNKHNLGILFILLIILTLMVGIVYLKSN